MGQQRRGEVAHWIHTGSTIEKKTNFTVFTVISEVKNNPLFSLVLKKRKMEPPNE